MKEGQIIEVEFESNEKDFQRVLLWYYWKRMVVEFGLIIILGIPLCYFLGFNILDIKNNGWATLAFFVTVTILFFLDIYRRIIYQAKKLKEVAKPAKSFFSENGIESITPIASSNRNWESYLKVNETKTDFIFFSQENFFATIPKRFFKNESQITELRQLINEKLGERAKLQN